jgi:hypothetical protein
VHPAPLGGRDAHLVLKRALEGGLGLVAGKLGGGAGRHVRCLERVGSDRHADVSQQLGGETLGLVGWHPEGGVAHPERLEQPGAEELAEAHARELFDEITQRADCDK